MNELSVAIGQGLCINKAKAGGFEKSNIFGISCFSKTAVFFEQLTAELMKIKLTSLIK